MTRDRAGDGMPPPDLAAFAEVFARIGVLSFGGPAGQIALMHRELVEDRNWIDDAAFLRALNFCNLLPGPEAQQLATYIGWRLHGMRGGLIAGLLFVLPGAAVILALSLIYVAAAGQPWFAAIFAGVKAAVLALVAHAVVRIARRALTTRLQRTLALAAFVALAILSLPFFAVVLGAGLIGFWCARPCAGRVVPIASHRPAVAVSLRALLLWTMIWAAPFVAIASTLGTGHVLFELARYFAGLSIVTFGGAYAVLASMAQTAVQSHGWLTAREMADGLGLAESTPGPLVLVTQFVGFMAAWRHPAPFSPLSAALLGALVTSWVTFAPCFLWIFTLAPWIDRLEHAPRLQGALSALTAAVIGVIANLAVWFGLHVLFARVDRIRIGIATLDLPQLQSFNALAAALAVIAGVLLFRCRIGTVPVLALCGVGALTGWLSA